MTAHESHSGTCLHVHIHEPITIVLRDERAGATDEALKADADKLAQDLKNSETALRAATAAATPE